jgi:hypothetical protein
VRDAPVTSSNRYVKPDPLIMKPDPLMMVVETVELLIAERQ